MSALSVVIVGLQDEQQKILQMLIDNTSIAKTAYCFSGYPIGPTDLAVRRTQDIKADVVMVDIQSTNSQLAIRAIELMHVEAPWAAIFAIGDTKQPQQIISAMRAGSREFMERPCTTNNLLEAFARLTSTRRKQTGNSERGKIFAIVNAKGGSGATTVAVNMALALQAIESRVALVDLAPLGHAALHLNARPSFTVADAFRNLTRLDPSLLEGLMTQCQGGVQLLAGASEPITTEPSGAELARLFDLLVSQYRFVVVDLSSRLDAATRVTCDLSDEVLLIAQTDVASLWSVAKVQAFLGEGGGRERIRLLLNRFRKVTGFSEEEIERATRAKLFWKIPNHYQSVSAAIDSGSPLTQHNHSELSRAFVGLANALRDRGTASVAGAKKWPIFKTGIGA
jgi:pilus assembly protein CpaE